MVLTGFDELLLPEPPFELELLLLLLGILELLLLEFVVVFDDLEASAGLLDV